MHTVLYYYSHRRTSVTVWFQAQGLNSALGWNFWHVIGPLRFVCCSTLNQKSVWKVSKISWSGGNGSALRACTFVKEWECVLSQFQLFFIFSNKLIFIKQSSSRVFIAKLMSKVSVRPLWHSCTDTVHKKNYNSDQNYYSCQRPWKCYSRFPSAFLSSALIKFLNKDALMMANNFKTNSLNESKNWTQN